MALDPLSIILSVPPDFHICDEMYGTRLLLPDCSHAGYQYPRGATAVPYHVHGTEAPYTVPFAASSGHCMITLEQAGPSPAPGPVMITPDVVRALAGFVVRRCVEQGGGVGGFVTFGLANLQNYLGDPATDLVNTYYPTSTSFITVTVGTLTGEIEPGDENKAIPLALARSLRQKGSEAPSFSALQQHYFQGATAIFAKAVLTGLGKPGPWWQNPITPDQMSYECDTHLGAPRKVDCNQLQYSQLSGATDSVAIGPGAPRYLHSKSCDVAITAEHQIVITWEQIKAAVDTIIDLCVSNPTLSSVGGKAYYSLQAALPSISGRRKRNPTRRSAANGLNALPPAVNVTLYYPGHFHS